MVRLLVILMLLVASPVWACDSYEECIDKCTNGYYICPPNVEPGTEGYPECAWSTYDNKPCTKAIAYKLDEISKQLEYAESIAIDFMERKGIGYMTRKDNAELNNTFND